MPHNKDHSTLGSFLESPIYENTYIFHEAVTGVSPTPPVPHPPPDNEKVASALTSSSHHRFEVWAFILRGFIIGI